MSEEVRNSVEVSHGRGGAGNIGPDSTQYVDGEIVRQGVVGDHGDGAYSAGRGGAGNIGSPHIKPTERKDADAIPESALRPSQDDQNYHAGRGGAGNAHHADDKKEGPKHPEGLADKLKKKLFGSKKKEAAPTPAAPATEAKTTTTT